MRILSLILLIFSTSTAFGQEQIHYKGKVDDYAVEMILNFSVTPDSQQVVEGNYFYASNREMIPLLGQWRKEDGFLYVRIGEADSKGKPRAMFEGVGNVYQNGEFGNLAGIWQDWRYHDKQFTFVLKKEKAD